MYNPKDLVEYAKKTSASQTRYTFFDSSTLIVPYSPQRIFLEIAWGGLDNFQVRFGADASSTNGVNLSSLAPPLQYDVKRHGSVVHGPFFASGDALTGGVALVMEVLGT